MRAALLRAWPAALVLAWLGCRSDIGTVGESTAQAVAGTGGAGSSAGGGAGTGAVSTVDAGDEDEDDELESEDEAPEDEGCDTLPLLLLGVSFPDSLCAACDDFTPCADELECIDSQCSQCEDDDECGDDGRCDHAVCIPEDAEEAEP